MQKIETLTTTNLKVVFFFVSFLLPISFLYIKLVWHLDFWMMDNNMGIGCY
jgi:hypothetical protein